MAPLRELELIHERLAREARDTDAEGGQRGVRIAKGTRLRRAPARTGGLVPPGEHLHAGTAGAGIDVEHVDVTDVHRPERRLELEVRQLATGQMVRGTVVLGHGQVRRQRIDVVRHETPQTCMATRA